MLVRANTLSIGHSGVRLQTLNTLLAMLNAGVHPVVPEIGSLGASGDLAPLSHLVLVMSRGNDAGSGEDESGSSKAELNSVVFGPGMASPCSSVFNLAASIGYELYDGRAG